MNTLSAKAKKGRPPVAQQQVFKVIHQRIISGELAPASRLPTRRELGDAFNVGLPAVQRALETLIEDGFVIPRGTQGTFVADNPPHLSRYGLVFEDPISNNPLAPTPRFWTALLHGAERLSQRIERPIEIFNGVCGQEFASQMRRLSADVRRHRLAGLFFPSPPIHLNKLPLMLEPGMPRVATVVSPEVLPMHRLMLSYGSFFDRALESLLQQGCKRIAIIRNIKCSDQIEVELDAALRHHKIDIPDYWHHAISTSSSPCIASLVHLMFREDQQVRPDGLLLADDSFIEFAAQGLQSSGMPVGGDDGLKIVAHCNFPWPKFDAMPMLRLGFDTDLMLSEAIRLIDQSRQGDPDWHMIQIPAVFEDEYILSKMSSSG